MAQQTINRGSSSNDGTGDPLRTAFNKINSNFTELYGASPFGQQVSITGNQISASSSNADLVLSGSGTGGVIASGLRFGGTSISADDSSIVNINEGLNVTGNITAEGNITATGNIFANGNINLGNAADDQTKVVGVFEADNIQIDGTTITTNTTNGSVTITGNATGGVNIENFTINDNAITSPSNSDISLQPGGTGGVVASGIRVQGTSLSADDSSIININEGLIVDGTGNFSGTLTTAGITTTGTHAITGQLDVDGIRVKDNIISGTRSNDDISIQPSGTGDVVLSALRVNGTTIDSSDSTKVTIAEAVDITGNTTVAGTLTTADITQTGNTTTVGNNTVQGLLTATSLTTNDITTNGSNADITIDPQGTGAVVIPTTITHTGTQTTTGQLNVDNLRLDGNVLSATSGGITLTPAGGSNVQVGGILTATEANFTLVEAPTVRADRLENDTSDGDIAIHTQGTGVVDFNTATQTTVGSAGGANALPGQPTGYLEVKIAGTARVIPFYDKS